MSTPFIPLSPREALPLPPVRYWARPWLRILGLMACLFCSLALYFWLGSVTPTVPNNTASSAPFIYIWLLTFVPYAVASVLLLTTRSPGGRWLWGEVGLILIGALVMRAMLLGFFPNLSHDSWRYVWDARVLLHGYSPYVTLPNAKELLPLHDFIYANSRFRDAPSIYPPGAQYIYLISYLLAPSNLFFLKGIFVLFDLLSCVVLALLLMRRGIDPARMLLYAWSPLPIVEFALEGHLDGLPIAFALLAVFSASRVDWQGRTLTGFLVGMGTLMKIYPLVLLVPLVDLRAWKRDLPLVLTCALTIGLGYVPFILIGHGQIFGFFSTYASEQGENAGMVQHLVADFGLRAHFSLTQIIIWEHSVALLLLLGASVTILVARSCGKMSLEAGTLILFSLVLSVSSHVFPWYVPTLLPWIVLLLPQRNPAMRRSTWLARGLILGALWAFTVISILGYLQDWPTYYLLADSLLALEVLSAGLVALWPTWFPRLSQAYAYTRQKLSRIG